MRLVGRGNGSLSCPTGQNTPALEIKMYWVFLSVPLGLGLMALRTLERMWRMFRGKDVVTSTEEY